MTSFISLLIYLLVFVICFMLEIRRNMKWNLIKYPKSRLESQGITAIYFILFIIEVFFMIINLLIGESADLCVSITLVELLMMFMVFILSRVSIVITDDKIIKKNFLGKTIIRIKEIRSIEFGYFITIKTQQEQIRLETKFYDSSLINIENRLSEIM